MWCVRGLKTSMCCMAALMLPTGILAQGLGTSIFNEPDQLWVIDGVQVPAVADTFALMRVSRFPVTDAGVALTYAGPITRSLDLTVYVYPPDADDSDPVASEFALTVRGIRDYAAQQQPAWSVAVEREEAFELILENGQALPGMVAEAEYTHSGRTSRTIAYLFQKGEVLLKYRMTYDAAAAPEDLPQHLDAWLRTTASRINPYADAR